MSNIHNVWTHTICEDCWNLKHPEGRTPLRLVQRERHIEACCFCNKPTASGIYVREAPYSSNLSCKGTHHTQ